MNTKEYRSNKFKELSVYFEEEIKEFLDIDLKAKMLSLQTTDNDLIKRKVSSLNFKNEDVISSIENISSPLILVFNSAHNPGGGVMRGSIAQEEDIALKSTWYFQVKDNEEYYKQEHETLLYSDEALYVKKALLLTDNQYNKIMPKKISLIGAAAPNLNGMKTSSKKSVKEDVLYETLKNRIIEIFKIAEKEQHKHLILGAWGCGVFGLEPKKVALIFNKVINENYYSGNVVFAILDKEMHNIFKDNIKLDNLKIQITKKNKKPA